MRHDEYIGLDATALAELVRRGDVSPAELLALARAQAGRVQPRLNAFVRELPELAERQLARLGERPSGALAGVPFVVKDSVVDVAGVPTGYGSRAFAGIVPTADAAVLRRLLDAGAVVFAKTNLPECGLKGISDSRAFGPVSNPWDATRNAGGSSGGSAAAVAAGVVPMAGGNDGGGSLRIPAAFCGLFALKPSRGRISNGPGLGEVWFGARSEGVISRSVRDSALALDLLCGAEPGDPAVTAPPAAAFRRRDRASGRRGCGWRSGPSRRWARRCTRTRPPRCAPPRRGWPRSATGSRRPRPPVDGHAVADAYLHLYAGQVPAVIAYAKAQGASERDFEPLTRLLGAVGSGVEAGALTLRLAHWNAFSRTLGAFFERHDVWLTPTTAQPALRHGALDAKPAEARLLSALLASGMAGWLARRGWLARSVERLFVENLAPFPFTQLANLAGVPAMTLPLHASGPRTDPAAERLPLGVQCVGRLGDEATLLQLAAEVEADAPWFDRLPPIGASDRLTAAGAGPGRRPDRADRGEPAARPFGWCSPFNDRPVAGRLRWRDRSTGPATSRSTHRTACVPPQPCRPRRASGPALRLAQSVHRTACVPPQPPRGIGISVSSLPNASRSKSP
ncbi:MAG: amidase [Comamonadaceae bacterium]|nr:amidase [Comamonadaceae bacterium]